MLSIPNGVARPRIVVPGVIIISYTCNSGYQFINGIELSLSCTNGTMAHKPPPCERELYMMLIATVAVFYIIGITCPPLEPIANGRVIVSGSGLGATATYSCDDDFILFSGFSIRVCKDSQTWSGYAGVCKRT